MAQILGFLPLKWQMTTVLQCTHKKNRRGICLSCSFCVCKKPRKLGAFRAVGRWSPVVTVQRRSTLRFGRFWACPTGTQNPSRQARIDSVSRSDSPHFRASICFIFRIRCVLFVLVPFATSSKEHQSGCGEGRVSWVSCGSKIEIVGDPVQLFHVPLHIVQLCNLAGAVSEQISNLPWA